MRIVFFGTPQFAADVLTHLLQNNIEIAAVITKPDRPQGRSSTPIPTPVKTIALAHTPPIPVFQPEMVSDPAFAPTLENFSADLFVVVAYGEIIKQHLLDMPKVACINLHASLLPKYRGAAPIQRCIINGEKETGVTTMHMVKKMDAGDIIEMEKIEIPPNMTYGELETALCQVGSKLLLQTIRKFENGTAPRTPQDHDQATLAPKIELEDCQIDWNKSAESIHNLVRGVNPHPGAWCQIDLRGQNKRLHIIETRVTSTSSSSPQSPGTILAKTKEGMVVACGLGELLLTQVKLEGKKAMNAAEFARGLPSDVSFK